MVALHGAGMIHLAERPDTNASVSDMEYRIGHRDGANPGELVTINAKRIGCLLYTSYDLEPQ